LFRKAESSTSIRTRLTLSHLAVIVVAMGLTGFLLLSFLDQYFIQATEESLIAHAREHGLPLLCTPYTMFTACGRLYEKGLRGVEK